MGELMPDWDILPMGQTGALYENNDNQPDCWQPGVSARRCGKRYLKDAKGERVHVERSGGSGIFVERHLWIDGHFWV
jgi:hypothetical protein